MKAHCVYRVLELSTAHLPEAALTSIREPLGCQTAHGALVFVPPDLVTVEGTPEELEAVLAVARSRHCRWVLFDADAEVDKTLKTYVWSE